MNTLRALALAAFVVPSALAAPTVEPDWARVERNYRELPVEARQHVGPLFCPAQGPRIPPNPYRGGVTPVPAIASFSHSRHVRRSTWPSQ